MPGANVNDILVFMAVVDAGTLVGGGRAMGLTRSAAGKAVSRLEDRLGTRLLHRTTRTLSSTDEGRELYRHGLRIRVAIDDAEASVAGPAGVPRGLLRLTAPDAYGRSVILPLLARYLETWPEVRVEVSLTDRLIDLVDEGFDLAIRIGANMPDSRLVSRAVGTCTGLLCVAPDYIARHGEPANIDALADHDCLLFSSRGLRQEWSFRGEDGNLRKATVRSRLKIDSGQALRDAAVSGLGIALLPDFLAADDLVSGRLVQVLAGLDAGRVDVVALYPTKRLLEPRVRHFIDSMLQASGA